MMWIAVRRFLGGNWLMVGMVSALVVSVLGWDSSRKAKWVESGKQEIVRASQEQGAQNAAAAEKAHDIAKRPGAADRLRQDRLACPDCSK